MNKYLVLKDTREKDGWNFPESETCLGTKIATIKTGDYSIQGYEKKLCIERKKSPEELAANLGKNKKRFDNEIDRMRDFEHAFIICEFSLSSLLDFPHNTTIPNRYKSRMRITGYFILKCLMEYSLNNNVHVLFADNARSAQALASSIFKRVLENESKTKR